MSGLDRLSSLFWLVLSLLVMGEAWRMGIGSVQKPGPGFIAFGTSALLGILSLALFLRAGAKKAVGKKGAGPGWPIWQRVGLVLGALFLYSKLMPVGGYLVCTFGLMTFLFWIVERKKLVWPLISSLAATVLTYYLFSRLGCSFPPGPFDF
jgi:hypothetical protein